MNKKKSPISLHNIKNISSLQELSKFNTEIKNFAKHTLYSNYEEVIQETYIKIHNMFEKYPSTIIDGGYIATSLRNTSIDLAKINERIKRNIINENVYMYEDLIENLADTSCTDVAEYEKLENDKWLRYCMAVTQLEEHQQYIWEYAQQMSIMELAKQAETEYKPLLREFNKIKSILINKLNENGK